jgi:hypothetical protein
MRSSVPKRPRLSSLGEERRNQSAFDEDHDDTGRSCVNATDRATSLVDPIIVNESDDPFPSSLRCQSFDPTTEDTIQVLWWRTTTPHIPVATEEALLPLLLHWKKKERNMFRQQPPFRLPRLQRLCHSLHVPLITALSLRRHHIKQNHPFKSMEKLGLGCSDDIRASADMLERAVADALRCHHTVAFFDEAEQKAHIDKYRRTNPDNAGAFPPTPDFILQRPVRVKTYQTRKNNKDGRSSNNRSSNNNYSNDQRYQQRPSSTLSQDEERFVVEQRVISCT